MRKKAKRAKRGLVDPYTEKTRRCHVDRSGDISFVVVETHCLRSDVLLRACSKNYIWVNIYIIAIVFD